MYTFDAWDAAIRPPENYLMHFRTPGSKNGVRKYQNPDGTWTELGLQERAKREGWDHEKEARKAQKQAAKLERKQAKQAAKAQAKFERSEQKRKSKLSGLTDAEMAAKLKRAKMEAEYRELTKKDHAVLEAGSKLVGKILDYKQNRDMRMLDLNKQKLEIMRMKTEQMLAKEQTKRAQEQTKQAEQSAKKADFDRQAKISEAEIAKENRKKMEADVAGGLKIERKTALKRAKKEYRETTVRGAIGKFFNSKAKDAGEASGAAKKSRVQNRADKRETDTIIRNEKKVSDYNARSRTGDPKIESQRQLDIRKQANKEATAIRVATQNAKKSASDAKIEEAKAKQEEYKWKSKVGRKS